MIAPLQRRLDWQLAAAGSLGWPGSLVYRLQRLRARAGLHAGAPMRLTSKHLNHPVWFRPGTSDLDVFHQIFFQREYSCLDDLREPELIIDLGANVGYASAWFLSRHPRAKVIAVEPDAGNFALLQENVRPYGARCLALNTGVWSHATGLKMVEFSGDGREWAYTVRPAREGEAATLQATDVGTLLRESGLERISILKVDIEGAEREVFDASAKAWIGKVENLVIELHGAEETATFEAAIAGEPFTLSRSGELTVCRRQAVGVPQS